MQGNSVEFRAKRGLTLAEWIGIAAGIVSIFSGILVGYQAAVELPGIWHHQHQADLHRDSTHTEVEAILRRLKSDELRLNQLENRK